MEAWKILTIATFSVIVLSSVVLTEPMKATFADGKALFNETLLGSSQKSCATCHPGGKGLEGVALKTQWRAGGTDFSTIEGAINACVKGALKGPSLSEDSYQTRSLALYLGGFRQAAAEAAPVQAEEEDDEDKFGC